MLTLYVDAIADYPVSFPALSSAIENAICCSSSDGLKPTNRIGQMLSRFLGHVESRPWLRHRDNGNPCIVALGEGEPMFDCLCCKFRAVSCN